jgi:hypothetical protein
MGVEYAGNTYKDQAELDEFLEFNRETEVRAQRKNDYPSIGEQFDALWHAIDEGTLDKTSDFYTMIKAVKDKHPKPE